jgi:hypothetical protein
MKSMIMAIFKVDKALQILYLDESLTLYDI